MSRFEQFSLSIFGITHYWNKIATEEMKEHGLKGAYAMYLIILANNEEEMTASRLSEITLRDKADVSRAIAQFQKQGIVESYGTTRYRAPIRLTDKGRTLAAQISKKASTAIQIAGEGLSEEMRKNMYQALDIISGNLKEMYKEKPKLD
ncbi:MAG: MarR family transcriptional regulator [Lachnospiraceae bacterium]|nr:MarR family transcriptional regulator [Lachnospiraceae bacterium]